MTEGHPELGGHQPDTWSASVQIPATAEEAADSLNGVARLVLAKDWERAAIVYAFTRRGEPGEGGPGREQPDNSVTLPISAFAALGIAGLNSHVTVRRYRRAWEYAMEEGAAEEALPGGRVDLPNLAWPADEGGGAHVGNNSGKFEWFTPPAIIAAATRVMGSIDLDPCSTAEANEVVQAKTFYTQQDNGLDKDWAGTVFLNPPYASDLVTAFCAKLAQHHAAGDVPMAITLTTNATETAWWQNLATWSAGLCFPRGRIRFWEPGHDPEELSLSPLQGHSLMFLGPPDAAGKFSAEFSGFGATW
jgi:DNA N-6-adenine-methyltransferase (Dam)